MRALTRWIALRKHAHASRFDSVFPRLSVVRRMLTALPFKTAQVWETSVLVGDDEHGPSESIASTLGTAFGVDEKRPLATSALIYAVRPPADAIRSLWAQTQAATEERTTVGPGRGLSTCLHLAGAPAATFAVQSAPGCGTAVCMIAPAAPQE